MIIYASGLLKVMHMLHIARAAALGGGDAGGGQWGSGDGAESVLVPVSFIMHPEEAPAAEDEADGGADGGDGGDPSVAY